MNPPRRRVRWADTRPRPAGGPAWADPALRAAQAQARRKRRRA